jgi:outer membrane protein assembly factor BamB
MRPSYRVTIIFACVALLCVAVSGCAPLGGSALTSYRDQQISSDTTWSGRILVDGVVTVAKGATLTIAPGSDIAFVARDADRDGLGDAALVVEGGLVAVGTRSAPIRFHSAATEPKAGDWLELRVDFSREVQLRYCEIRDSAYTLHAHFSRGTVADSTIHYNIDGSRLGQSSFTLRNNLIEHNQSKGINFRNSNVTIQHNIVRHNGSGIFLFENDREVDIHHNNIYANLDNFRLGDFYRGDVALRDNWWGSAEATRIAASIYDQGEDERIGRVTTAAAAEWLAGSGPRDLVGLSPAWQVETGGYVDASPISDGQRIYLASWDGTIRALTPQGAELWSRQLGDTVDATPASADGRLFVQSWGREVYALDAASGRVLWRVDYSPSRADDHRQGALLPVGDLVLLPAWNGNLTALDAATGERRWSFAAGQPLRAAPLVADGTVYQASGSGLLSALALDGTLRWQVNLGQPLLSTPAVSEQGVVLVGREGRLTALDRQGTILWQRELDEPCYYGAPVVAGDALLLATAGGSLWKLDLESGELIWRVPLSGPSYATPSVANGRIFIGDNSGGVQLFGLESGDLLTKVSFDREVQGRALLLDGLVVVGSRDQRLYALRLDTAAAQPVAVDAGGE